MRNALESPEGAFRGTMAFTDIKMKISLPANQPGKISGPCFLKSLYFQS